MRRAGAVRIAIEREGPHAGGGKFEGNAYLSDATLHRALLLEAGELYNRDAVSRARSGSTSRRQLRAVHHAAAGDSIKT